MAVKIKIKPKGAVSAAPAKKKPKRSVFDTGRQENESSQQKRDARMNKPFSFWLKEGESANVILLDDAEPEALFATYMHQWKGRSGKWDQEDVCIKDEGVCPLCQKLEREGQFVMYLTCLDSRPYTNKKGVTIKYGRKLLPVKPTMIAKFERLYRKHGTFRGMMITLHRDGAKSTNIGDSVEFVKFVKPDFLEKIEKRPNDQGKVCNYKKAFPRPEYKDMVRKYGGSAIPGQEDDSDDDLGDVEI